MRLPVNTVIHATLVGLEPATFRSLVDCWSDALPEVPPTHKGRKKITAVGYILTVELNVLTTHLIGHFRDDFPSRSLG